MITYFCPACWRIVKREARRCAACGADLFHLDQGAFAVKLVEALRHPEPTIRQRAAFILGELGDGTAAAALGLILLGRQSRS